MRFSQRTLIAAAATAAIAVLTGPAMAHGYSGAYPVTVTNSQFFNGTGCLTLTGNGISGSASLVAGSQKYPYGSFVVVNHILMATIVKPSGSQNGALTSTPPRAAGTSAARASSKISKAGQTQTSVSCRLA